jgi:hypothetical protein
MYEDIAENIKLYPGNYIHIDKEEPEEIYVSSKPKKVIVLDLDETIGSFSDLYVLWSTIYEYIDFMNKYIFSDDELIQSPLLQNIHMIEFNLLLDLYPEFFRHGIIHILEFIYNKKKQGLCKIYLYTNNQIAFDSDCSPTKWVSKIVEYLTNKICDSVPLFDQLICAFKINRKIIEIKRTTKTKTYSDFIRCTVLPKTTEICFIDDSFFPGMASEKVYYIQPKGYKHYLNKYIIITRLLTSNLIEQIPIEYRQGLEIALYDSFGNPDKPIITKCQIENDIIISRKLMYYINEFFYLTTKKSKTRRLRKSSKIGTRKIYL